MLDAANSPEFLDRVGEGVIALDPEWRVAYLNHAAERLLAALIGVPGAALRGAVLWAHNPAFAGSPLGRALRGAFASQQTTTQELYDPAAATWLEARAYPSRGGVTVFLRDITAQKTALSIGGGESLLDGMRDVFIACDHQWRLTYVNARADHYLALIGLRRDDVVGRELWGVLPALAGTRFQAEAVRAVAEQGEIEFQELLAPLNRWFTVRIVATQDGVIATARDVTQRKRAEEQIRQAQKMDAVGRLAGGVAHDFNNMMMIVLGFSDFLLASLDCDDPRWADADEIRKAAERAMQLTRQLLSFGRQQLVARQVLSVNDVIVGMERMLRPLLGENVRLEMKLFPELGGVEADYGQLEQVIMNLALNARDAMPRGGRLIIETTDVELPRGYGYQHVGIELPAGPYVILRVSDTGHGMTPDVKARLFEPFFTTKSAERNTGLGLATVYGIVAQSGGYIWVDSEPGQGATFTICFPRALAEDVTPVPTSPAEMPAGGTEVILLVEDEEAVRGLARRVLVNQGYTVLEAANGREALELLCAPHPPIDLVLTDVVMPELGGQELVEELLRVQPGLRVVYMSGYAESEKLLQAIQESPHDSFLQKPFSAESLASKIREALDRGAPLLG